jgi:hypothetical protein
VGPDPHGEVPDPCTYRPDLRVRTRISTGVPGPPLCRARATHSKVPGQSMHGPWTGPRRGSGDNTYPDPVWCGPVRLRHCSPPRRRPDAVAWPTARDVSRRAELDVRPPGYAAPAFIADKARRLSVPLTSDVPPQHLMSPVYSAGRDVPPRHLMCPVHSAGRRRPAVPQATCLSIPLAGSTPVLRSALCSSSLVCCQGSFRCTPMLRRLQISGHKEITLATNISCFKYYIRYVPGPACRGSAPLYVPPFSYKRGRHATLQGSDTLRPSSGSQVHASSQTQYITQWSRVLRSGGPNLSKPLCVLVFIHRLVDRQNA